MWRTIQNVRKIGRKISTVFKDTNEKNEEYSTIITQLKKFSLIVIWDDTVLLWIILYNFNTITRLFVAFFFKPSIPRYNRDFPFFISSLVP